MAGDAQAEAGRGLLAETGATLALAMPLVAGQLGQMLIALVDTMLIGRLGVVPLAAASLTNSLTLIPLVFGLGLLTAVAVRVAQARGAGNRAASAEALRHGLVVALGFGLLVGVVLVGLSGRLDLLGQPVEVVRSAPVYLQLVGVSLLPALLTAVLKNFADALGRPWWPFWIMLAGVGLNILLNWMMIFGRWGAPALGLEGAGLATLVARLATLAGMAAWICSDRRLASWRPQRWWRQVHGRGLGGLLRLGLPASFQQFAEVSAFGGGTLLVGWLGAVALGAHQIAMTCAATAFMVPLGLSMAITVRVGAVVGAGQRERLRRIMAGAWLLIGLFAALTMAVFVFGGEWLARGFVNDHAVLELAVKLMVVAGIFQVVDGFQVVCAGALRGAGDVVAPAWLCAAAYLGIGLPLGGWLMFVCELGAVGFWYGLAAGLAGAALLLGLRARRVLLAG